jgi:hypothetical protein
MLNFESDHFTVTGDMVADSVQECFVEQIPNPLYDKRGAVNYAGIPSGIYYQGQGDTYDEGFGYSTTYAEMIAAFDDLKDTYGSNYMTKHSLGVSSDSTKYVYEYRLTPKSVTYDGSAEPKKMPKVLIVSGQHGFEKSSIYGLYYLMRDLMTKYAQNPILDYIRNHVEIRMIPIANPYGFENNLYLNKNGVNLNRNYDTPGFPADPSAEPGTDQYGGVEPFDQPETQIIRDWVLDNLDAAAGLDFHTNGSGNVSVWKDVNWISVTASPNEYYHRLWDAAFYQISNITAHFVKDYDLNIGDNMLGRITGVSNIASVYPSANVWITDQGIPAVNFEGFKGFVDNTATNGEVQKANSELIGNWIIAMLNALK